MRSRAALLFLFLIFGLTSIACRLFSSGVGEETEVTTEPTVIESEPEDFSVKNDAGTETQAADETATATAPATLVFDESPHEGTQGEVRAEELLDLAVISKGLEFDSYRFFMLMAFEGTDVQGNAFLQNIEAEVAYSGDPEAMSVTMRLEGIEQVAQFKELVMAQIGDTSYMVMPGLGCVTTEAGEGSLLDNTALVELLDPDLLLQDLKGARLVGEELVNGIPTYVYTFDESYLETQDKVKWADGQIYVAKAAGYMVRLEMDGEGALDLLRDGSEQQGKLHVEFDLSDVNQPVDIVIPAECGGEAGREREWPLLADAFEVSTIPGMLSYQSKASFEDALAFYAEAMEEAGWEEDKDQAVLVSGSSILTFLRDEESVTLTIGHNDQTDNLFLLISDEASR